METNRNVPKTQDVCRIKLVDTCNSENFLRIQLPETRTYALQRMFNEAAHVNRKKKYFFRKMSEKDCFTLNLPRNKAHEKCPILLLCKFIIHYRVDEGLQRCFKIARFALEKIPFCFFFCLFQVR